MLQYFIRLFNMLSFTFLLLQKSNKKGARQRITSPLSVGTLIWLLYYCGFYIGNTTLRMKQPKYLLKLFN